MHLLWIAVVGLVLGLAARLVVPGRRGPFGFLLTGLLGLTGAFAAASLGEEGGWYAAGSTAGLVTAAFGAVLVLAAWAFAFRSRRPTSSI